MGKNNYKIFEIDEYNGAETHIATFYDRIGVEQVVMFLNEQNIPCTSYCYYDNEGIRYTYNDIKQSWGIK